MKQAKKNKNNNSNTYFNWTNWKKYLWKIYAEKNKQMKQIASTVNFNRAQLKYEKIEIKTDGYVAQMRVLITNYVQFRFILFFFWWASSNWVQFASVAAFSKSSWVAFIFHFRCDRIVIPLILLFYDIYK